MKLTDLINKIKTLHSSNILSDDEVKKDFSVYLGIEPSSDFIHFGTIAQLKILSDVINICSQYKINVKPIVLIGGFTVFLGDPSDKLKTRGDVFIPNIQSRLIFFKNIITKIFKSFNQTKLTFVNNADWLNNMSFNDYLKIAGKLSINKIIQYEWVQNRLKNQNNLSLKEFIYSTCQGLDFLYLYEKYNCIMQIAGSDQWCNMLTGYNLIKNKHGVKGYIVCTNLVTDEQNNKISKTTMNSLSLKIGINKSLNFLQGLLKLHDNTFNKIVFDKEESKFKSAIKYLHIIFDKKVVLDTLKIWELIQQNNDNEIIEFIKNSSNIHDIIEIKKINCVNSNIKIISYCLNISLNEARRKIKNKIKFNTTIKDNICLAKVGKNYYYFYI